MIPMLDKRAEFVPSEVRGELARVMAQEITRPATKEEIDVLRKAMKNRVPRRGKKS